MNDTSQSLPPVLCVDLDGTLVRTDTLHELLLVALRRRPTALLALPGLLLRGGRAAFKEGLASRVPFDVTRLPYHRELIAYLESQKAAGRRLVLATASNRRVAESVAEHLGLFDEVLGSDAGDNLRGERKARALVERFGVGGFAYAGNDAPDLAVWAAAGAAVIVSAPESVRAQVAVREERAFPAPGGRALAVLRALRVHHWTKNLLVFVPVVTGGAIADGAALGAGLLAFACFCLLASGTYVVNDLMDLDADRAHPGKRHRPFASGELPLGWGVVLGPTLIAAGIGGAAALGGGVALTLAAYLVGSSAYTLALRSRAVLDTFTLAALYTLRVVAGGAATGLVPSVWLLNFSGFLFLALAFLKRVVELGRVDADTLEGAVGRGYRGDERVPLLVFGVASSFASALVLALYVDTGIAHTTYAAPELLWALVPLCLFWQCRMWLYAHRGRVDDDPLVWAARDGGSWLTALLSLGVYLLALGDGGQAAALG